MIISEDELTKLLMAILVGGLIGIEREFRDKTAGFRTNILICMGATLFTMFSLKWAVMKIRLGLRRAWLVV